MLIIIVYRYIGSDKAIADLPFMNGNVILFFFSSGYRYPSSTYNFFLPSSQAEVSLHIFSGGVPI